MTVSAWESALSFGLLVTLVCFYVLLGWRVLASYQQNQQWPWAIQSANRQEARARLVLWIGYLGAHFFWLAEATTPHFIQIVFIPVFPWSWHGLRLAGVLLAFIAVLIWFVLALKMGSHWHIGIRTHPPPVRLIQEGAFSYLSHPLYWSLSLATGASFLAIPIWPFLLCVIICVYGWYLQAGCETAFLQTYLSSSPSSEQTRNQQQ